MDSRVELAEIQEIRPPYIFGKLGGWNVATAGDTVRKYALARYGQCSDVIHFPEIINLILREKTGRSRYREIQ